MCWVACDYVCRRKEEGDLGILRLKGFNDALFGKSEWRLKMEVHAFQNKMLSSKYSSLEEGSQGFRGATPRW